MKQLKDNQGRPIGIASDNPILDTRMYEVEYQDGHTAALAANIIAENIFAQVDEEGNRGNVGRPCQWQQRLLEKISQSVW